MGDVPSLDVVFKLSILLATSSLISFVLLLGALWLVTSWGYISEYTSLMGYALIASSFTGAVVLTLGYANMKKDNPTFVLRLEDAKAEEVSKEKDSEE